MRAILLVAAIAVLVSLAPASAGASVVKTDRQIRTELIRSCHTSVDWFTDAPSRRITRACTAYYRCVRASLNPGKIRRMYLGLQRSGPGYPFKAVNERCLSRAINSVA